MYKIRPITLVNITRIIHSTALSIPRALASRATQIKSAMLSTKKITGIMRIDEQTAHPPAAANGSEFRDHPNSAKARARLRKQ
jgi:hypothetical protein